MPKSGPVARTRSRAGDAHGALAGVRGVRARARRCVRERLERDARAGDRAPSRDRRPALHRREPRPHGPPAADRGAAVALLAGLPASGSQRGASAPRRRFFSVRCRRRWRILRLAPMTFDYRVFLFALVVAAAATLLFALLPALQASRPRLTDALRGREAIRAADPDCGTPLSSARSPSRSSS